MPSTISLKALGLMTSPNPLELPAGAMTTANNIIIKRNDVIESRRGFKLFTSLFGSGSDRAKQLIEYQHRLIVHYGSTLAYDTGTVDTAGREVLQDFSGSILEPSPGTRIKSVEANGNLYFTTADGIKKISASSSAPFGPFVTSPAALPGFIQKAGGIKAIDFAARLNIVPGNQTGWFPQNSVVAYRIVWGYNDANNNLILGTPSEREEIFNTALGLLIPDFMRTLGALDDINQTGSLITDGDYVSTLKLPANATATDLYNNLLALAAKIDADILYASTAGGTPLGLGAGSSAAVSANVATITFDAGTVTNYVQTGSKIFLTNFSGGASVLNGSQTVQTVGASTLTFSIVTPNFAQAPVTTGQVFSNDFSSIAQPGAPSDSPTAQQLLDLQAYLDNIIAQLQNELTGVISAPLMTTYIDPLDITTSATVILTINIPQGVTTSDFFQIYRTSVLTATGTTVLSELDAGDEERLVYEANPTAAQITAGEIIVEDIVSDVFAGANLYTNEFSGEGILQANDLPPKALDINRFKNYIFFANTSTLQRAVQTLIGTANFKAGGITSISAGTPTTITTDAPHELSTGDIVYIDGTNSTPPVVGLFTVTVTSPTVYTVPATVVTPGTDGYWTNAMVSISTGPTQNTLYKFILGTFETTTITCRAANDAVYLPGNLGGKYFTLNSANDVTKYYVWYNTGSDPDPMVAGRFGLEVLISAVDPATVVASKTADVISREVDNFNANVDPFSATHVIVENIDVGYSTDATVGTSQFSFSIVQGRGENAAKNEVLLVRSSDTVSAAQAVTATATSLIRVINKNASEVVNAYSLSGPSSAPGIFLLEARDLSVGPFYFLANNTSVGASFSPNSSPAPVTFPPTALTNTAANPTVITYANHGLVSGDQVLIEFSNSTPPIDGVYTINKITNNTFSIPVAVTTAGTSGVLIKVTDASVSDNESKPNRIYYSKFQQPDAVPVVNFVDVGAEHKAILRIFPLRDSLFIFKEDGLFRLSGDTAPFSVSLFDGSAILIAPDSLDTTNNLIYGWTTQGINTVSEAGVSLISRNIDVDILKLASSNYPNFATATFGVGYRSDNAYYIWTVKQTNDTVATICYRYSNLTSTWTTFDQSKTCGLVRPSDDKLYLGPGDINSIEQERKSFNRTDYSDREISTNLNLGNYINSGLTLRLPSATPASQFVPGDVVVQLQYLNVYTFNSLLKKLDIDPGVGLVSISAITTGATPTITTTLAHNLVTGNYVTLSSTNTTPPIDGVFQATVIDGFNFTVTPSAPVTVAGTAGGAKLSFYNTLKAIGGDNLRTDLLNLTAKLDTDPILLESDFSSSIAQLGPATITANTAANPTIVTSVGHGLQTGRIVIISGSDSTPPINGIFQVTVIDANTFSVPYSVETPGTTGTFSTISSDFRDIQACYNTIINKLNLNANVHFHNYLQSTGTSIQETVITNVNSILNLITVNLSLDLMVGPFLVYKAIPTNFTYSPITMGDSLGLKHLREATMLFENKAFTSAILSFSTDLLPQFIPLPFPGDGNGIFGFSNFGSGFFGGNSNSAPFRTYIPRQCQRCRYLVMSFSHVIAREQYGIFGMSVTGEIGLSERAYR